MKIIYPPNPLAVKIYLDDNEKQIFTWKYISHQLEEDLYSIEFYLEEGKYFSIEKAKAHCSSIERYKNGAKMFLEELDEPHAGDCIAFPASCARCYAESILEISTAPPSKDIGHAIFNTFYSINNKNNIQEAIQFLKQNYQNHSKYVEYLEEYGKKHHYII